MSDYQRISVTSSNGPPNKKRQLENGFESASFRKAVVVLTRLPEHKVGALRAPTSQQFYSEDESISSCESDVLWDEGSNSSDSKVSNNKLKTGAFKSHTAGPSPSPHIRKNTTNKLNQVPVIVSAAFSHFPKETTKTRPDLPEEDVKVDMIVLAKKAHMSFKRGKIVEILVKEGGRLKYKVQFEEKGKSLVSGHHIAFNTTAKVERLYVGARVVVQCEGSLFRPGILAELPARKNRLRFLVFMDDHTAVYVGLPSLHLMCRQLDDVLDDVTHTHHRLFMEKYLNDWPCSHLTNYIVGQSLNVELDGVQQKCEVMQVDSSLMQVVFQVDQHKEWIHRGSMRLEHMQRFLDLRFREEHKDNN
ncbi:uncharacterized protein V6R79_011488 [Siganus canaliculatus]